MNESENEVAMPMNVNLTPQLEDMVRKKVASGLYNSASEVVREALRLQLLQLRRHRWQAPQPWA